MEAVEIFLKILKIGVAFAVPVRIAFGRIGWVQAVGLLPGVGRAIAILIRRRRRAAEHRPTAHVRFRIS